MRVVWRPVVAWSLVTACGFTSPGSGVIPDDGPPHDTVVLDGVLVDAAGFDVIPSLCFGPAGAYQVCLPEAPSGPLALASAISTDVCAGGLVLALTAGPDVCVLAGTTVTANDSVIAFGSRPLVVLATGSMTISSGATIDVSSRRGQQPGAGADYAGCAPGGAPQADDEGGSGGVGGSFGTAGGAAGRSTRGNSTSGPPAPASMASFLRGGCPGRAGGNGTGAGGATGSGGGAVYLVSAGALELQGRINASGAGGGGAPAGRGGGGGGGSGGMIVLFGAPLVVDAGAQVWANGGGGGGGAATNSSGSDGSHAPNAATGGNRGTGGDGPGGSGDGGDGGFGAVQLDPGGAGDTEGRGGGGGGGGVGVIVNLSSNAPAGGAFSPPPS